MISKIQCIAVICSLFAIGSASLLCGDDLSNALSAVKTVDANGVGHEEAVKAMKTLNSASVDQIPMILEAMDGANSISINWMRAAVNSIVGRGGQLPRAEIKEYFDNKLHSSMGRLLAFELLTQGDEAVAASMIPFLIDDPSMPLRSKAVAALIEEASSEGASPVQAIGRLGYALDKAREVTQVQAIAKKLDSLGVKVNLQQQLGFLNTWHIVGSFDNKDMGGFDVAYGPEQAIGMIDLNATYKDMDGAETKWKEVTTVDPVGNVDLNSLVGKVKGATVYALGTFKAAEDGEAEIRIGSANATKIWLNGTLVMNNEIYHNSNSIDKFSGKITLKKGDNQLFIKVCQNEQTEPWAQDWQFQLRICDETGKPIARQSAPASQN
ncbi:MAG: hypothetical protein AB8B55_19165 [Mariniblastus sp.]